MIYTRLVTSIIDGDTFTIGKSIQGTKYIRIAGLNAPEKGQSGYLAAKRKLTTKILGKTINIRPVAWSYNRLVAHIS